MLLSRLLHLLLLGAMVYAGLALLGLVVADRMMFLPPRSSYRPGQLDVTRVPVGRGEWVAVQHLAGADARYTVIFSHGNAEDLGHLQPILGRLRAAGFAVLAYDYRGYGLSAPGRPTSRKASADLEAVYRHAISELDIPAARIVLHGRSVGSGPTLELAAREPVAGLILESAFTSAYRVMTRVGLLPFDRFPNLRHIRSVDAPILFIHGSADRVIPWWHGRRLYDAAPGPTRAYWVEGADHNDLAWVAGERYVAELAAFARFIDDGFEARR